MVLTNYAECSGTTTLGTNQTLSKDSLLDRGCMCFIYFTVCSIPTTLSRNETFSTKKTRVKCLYLDTRYRFLYTSV
jgi:hypothetical protein